MVPNPLKKPFSPTPVAYLSTPQTPNSFQLLSEPKLPSPTLNTPIASDSEEVPLLQKFNLRKKTPDSGKGKKKASPDPATKKKYTWGTRKGKAH